MIIFLLIIGAVLFGVCRGLQIAYDGSRGFYAYLNALYANYKENHTDSGQKETKIKPPLQFSRINNILFIGIDKFSDTNDTDADTLFVLNIEHSSGAVSVLLVPCNTAVASGSALSPVGSLQKYGTEKTLAAVSDLLELRIDQYVLMDQAALISLVNSLGGINLYIGADMNYDDPQGDTAIHLQKGYQHLDGQSALQYLQYRSDDLGDIGRAKRQEDFLKAFYTQALNLGTVPKIPVFIDALDNSVYTNTDLFSLASLKDYIWALRKNSLTVKTLPGKFSPDGSLWLPDKELINDTVRQMSLNSTN